MKKAFFIIFTLLSLVSYALASVLFYIFFTEQSPGMIMVLLIPTLVAGLLFGIAAFLIKKTQQLALNNLLNFLYQFNIALLFVGIIALIYSFMN